VTGTSPLRATSRRAKSSRFSEQAKVMLSAHSGYRSAAFKHVCMRSSAAANRGGSSDWTNAAETTSFKVRFDGPREIASVVIDVEYEQRVQTHNRVTSTGANLGPSRAFMSKGLELGGDFAQNSRLKRNVSVTGGVHDRHEGGVTLWQVLRFVWRG